MSGTSHGQGQVRGRGSALCWHVSCSLTSVEEELVAATEAVSVKEQQTRELKAEIHDEEQGRSPSER